MSFKGFWDWCRRHLLLVTILAICAFVVFGFVNIQILHLTSEPEFCAMCHPSKGHGPLAEVDSWEHSGHGKAGVSCLDCHGRPGVVGYVKAKMGGLKDLYMQFTISKEEKLEMLSNPGEDLVPSETCLFCHSDEANREYREAHKYTMKLVEMRMSDDVENPDFRLRKGLADIMTDTFVGGTHFDHALHIDGFGLSCRDCHFGVVHREQSKTDRMNMCLVCHAENVGSSAPQLNDCQTCHEAQVAMNRGQGAVGVEDAPSVMFLAEVDCQMCHTGVAKGLFRSTQATCLDYHDESYAEAFTDWSSSTRRELDQIGLLRVEVEAALKKAEKAHRNVDDAWELYARGLKNLRFVEDDGTFGVHNRDYAQATLLAAAKDFEEVLRRLKHRW